MPAEQLLTQLIERAIANGWKPNAWLVDILEGRLQQFPSIEAALLTYGVERIVFDHNFARAFWGETSLLGFEVVIGPQMDGWRLQSSGRQKPLKNWEYHLQQLALAEDRLAYVEKFLEPDNAEEAA